MQTKQIFPLLALFIAAALWSLGGVLIKILPLHPIAISGIRSFFAALFLLPFIRKIAVKNIRSVLTGALFYVLTVLTFVASTKLTTAANAILLQYTAPVFVGILSSAILKEKFSRSGWLITFIVLAGMVCFFIGNLKFSGIAGNALAIVSGFCFAMLLIFMKLNKTGGSLEIIFAGNVITAFFALPFLIKGDFAVLTWQHWIVILVLGCLQLGLAYVFYDYGVKHTSALNSILSVTIEPILNPLWAFLFIHENPGLFAIVGGIIVILTITGWNIILLCKKTAVA